MKDLALSTLKIYPKTIPEELKEERSNQTLWCIIQTKTIIVGVLFGYSSYITVCAQRIGQRITPLTHLKANLWFAKTRYHHNKLSSTVKRLCSKAGITGYKTNHSLRATAASRLYQTRVHEQLVMERTGHHSRGS